MKKLLFSLSFISCLALQGCVDYAPTARSIGSNTTQPASPEIRSKPPDFARTQRQGKAESYEQSRFGAEDAIANPASIPEDVLQILRRDERNRTCLAANESPKNIIASWFVASEMNLNDDDSTDLVVTATNPCLFGANVNPFWLFRNTPQGHELALSVSTLRLEVLNTRTKGYRDIRTTAATAKEILTTVYVFDGDEYRARRSSREPIQE